LKLLKIKIKKMQKNRILIKGNEAIAKGAIDAGLEAFFGYPITPQSELIEYLAAELPKLERIFVQAESEIAAINMVLGAAAAGAAVMTSSSSPGISLKQEGISYIAGCELPAVIVNIMRGGPGLGNIAPSQGDYFQATKGGGHGDYHSIVLAPNSIAEMYNIMTDAFNLAFKYRNPVNVVGDGVMGQMMENVEINSKKRQIVKGDLSWAVSGAKKRDAQIIRSLRLNPIDLEEINLRLIKKYHTIQENEQRFEDYMMKDAKICIVAFGLCSRIAKGVIERLRGKKVRVGLIRPITLWPFPSDSFKKHIEALDEVWVLELNSGQMVEDVRLTLNGKVPTRFFGKLGGLIPSETEIINFFTKTKDQSNV
jgi:2-oxoglutarate ferredoxin oxidoreductase subunit alpha